MKRRSKGLTVILSFFPGAGQMFQGFMFNGLLFMSAFFGMFFIANLFELYIVNIFLPVIWCYSFFDSVNKMNTPDEEFCKIEDKIPFNLKKVKNNNVFLKVFAVILIFAGAFSIWNIIYVGIWDYVYDTDLVFSRAVYFIVDLLGDMPRIIISIIVIIAGCVLIKSKKKELKEESKEN